MATRRPAILAMLVLAAGTSAPAQIPPLPTPASGRPILQEIVATQAFEERVNQYVTLHRLLEGPLPPLRLTRDMGQLQMTVRGLALRIRTARANARQGDLIRPDVARMFRRRIATCLPAAEWAAIFADNAAEAEDEEGMPAGAAAPARQHGVARAGAVRLRAPADARRAAAAARGAAVPHHWNRPGPVGPPRQPDRGLPAGRLRRSHVAATAGAGTARVTAARRCTARRRSSARCRRTRPRGRAIAPGLRKAAARHRKTDNVPPASTSAAAS